MGFVKKTATLPRSAYPRESLQAAAAALSARARVGLAPEGKRWRLSIEPLGRGDAGLLLGELLNEALSHERRQARLRQVRAAAGAVAMRLLEKGFPSQAPDPLEQLEPQVRLDRVEETEGLIERARSMR